MQAKEQNSKLDWMRCMCPVGVLAFVKRVVKVGPKESDVLP